MFTTSKLTGFTHCRNLSTALASRPARPARGIFEMSSNASIAISSFPAASEPFADANAGGVGSSGLRRGEERFGGLRRGIAQLFGS